jgi:hypothetical protein
MTLLSTLSQSLSHFQASIEGSSPYLNVYSYHSIVSLEEILAVVNQIVLSSFPRLLWPTLVYEAGELLTGIALYCHHSASARIDLDL